MSEGSRFDKLWGTKPDEDLVDALAHRDEYEPEAIEAAQRELARRQLDAGRISELGATAARTKVEEGEKAASPLRWRWRILMLLLSFGIPQIILGEYYRNNGYTRRLREVWIWMAYGLLFWLMVSLLMILSLLVS